MPSNYTQNLETVAPSIAINVIEDRNALVDVAESIGPALEQLGQAREAQALSETMQNFESDFNTYEQAVDDLTTQAQLDRVASKAGLDAWTRANPSATEAEQAQARAKYGYELDQITLREEQTGLALEAEKRALVRKWMTIRPDLAKEFQQTLAINKSLQELDQVSSRSDKRFDQVRAMEAEAAAMGVTLEHVVHIKNQAAKAAESTANFTLMSNAGKMAAPAFDAMMQDQWNAVASTLPSLVVHYNRATMGGNAGAGKAGEANLAALQTQMLSQVRAQRIEAERVAREAGTPMILDTSNLEEEINNTFTWAKQALAGSGDAANAASIARMGRDARDAAGVIKLVREMFGLDFSGDPSGQMAMKYYESQIKAMGSTAWNELLGQLSKEGGFNALVMGGKAGGPEATQMLSFMRVHMPRLEDMVMDPNKPFTPEQRYFTLSAMSAIASGTWPSATLVAQAGPAFTIMLDEAAKTPGMTPQDLKNIEHSKGGVSMMSYGTSWMNNDTLSANSSNAAAARALPPNEWTMLFKTHIEPKLEPKMSAVESPNMGAVRFDPTAAREPFRAEGMYNQKLAVQDLVDELNSVYTAIVNTRPDGKKVANQWAKEFATDKIGAPFLPPDAGNVAPPAPVFPGGWKPGKVRVWDPQKQEFTEQ